ncbi:LacI family DNA-binding transcriptional regulator [Microlunatus panaciterrae]|uniref:LacI family transcriptional regulator n=1 Tax=Microlunatus panaciterrae TaxID=400768 RepID=A0ABS2RQ96_9ACTN|nr:LacI family DNA-binding transcriptional regulator [Microlunatus panaciterrae]MBM7800662.1 LacI family transcriptional regulator [Microlunatus panaciterrae]
MAPTIRDVAEASGVSISTASKGLHGKGRMRDDTRDRIIAVARELGFRPNLNASSLTSGRTFTVGLLTRDGYGRFTPTLLGGIEDSLTAETSSLLLCDARRDTVRERHYLDALIAKRVDGLIITGRATDPTPHAPRNLPFPVVYAYRTSDDPTDTSVTVDDEHGGYLAGRQLLRQGCRSILHLTGPAHYLAVTERISGARRALAEHGLELPDERVVHLPFDENQAYRSVNRLLERFPDTDGIFCGNDQLGRGVADALTAAGRRVPEDIALVGFDNWTLLAAHTRPPLTSIDMNLYSLGRTVGETMLNSINGSATPGVVKQTCMLAIRESCPAPAEGDPVWTSDYPMIPDA